MTEIVRQAFTDWKVKEETANRLAAQLSGSPLATPAEEARRAATEAWHVCWEKRWQVEQEGMG